MGFSATRSRDHRSFNPEANAHSNQRAKQHGMTTRPTAFPFLLLTRGGRQKP